MLEVELATVEQLLIEISKRGICFLTLIPPGQQIFEHGDTNQIYSFGLSPQDVVDITQEVLRLVESVRDGEIPPNMTIYNRILDENGEVTAELRIQRGSFRITKEPEIDPWDLESNDSDS